MKTFITIIIVWILLFMLFYLSGCFSEATFNLADWTADTRNGIAITYLFCCVSTVIVVAAVKESP